MTDIASGSGLQLPSAREEWRSHWLLVAACVVGFSFHAVMSYALGLFMAPLNEEFGWSRAQISVGFTISALLTVPLAPLVGAMIDRWGVRRLALPGLVLKALSICVFATTSGSEIQWYALWVFYALVAMGVKSTVWSAAVSGAFFAGRGLALAVALSGTALTQIIAPPLAQWLIDEFGWRQAFVWLGIGWGLPALAFCYFCLYDVRLNTRSKSSDGGPTLTSDGLNVREALRNPALIRIAIATLITMMLGVGALIHMVPILNEQGFDRESAAYLASMAGVAGIIGKLFTGYLMDRFHAAIIGAITMAFMALGFVGLIEPFSTPTTAVIAIVVLGYSSGCKLQICAYLTGVYGGMTNFGKIFGGMSSLIALGSGVGPMLAGALYDYSGDYSLFLTAGVPAALVSGVLLFTLPAYPQWEKRSVSVE